jgi:hypothetical protein
VYLPVLILSVYKNSKNNEVKNQNIDIEVKRVVNILVVRRCISIRRGQVVWCVYRG